MRTFVSLAPLLCLPLFARACSGDDTAGCDGQLNAGVELVSDGGIGGYADLTFDPKSGTWVTIAIVRARLHLGDGLPLSEMTQFSGLNASTTYTAAIHSWQVHGDCSSVGPVLNPLLQGSPCDSAAPDLCAEGDLSGKHGVLTAGADGGAYREPFARSRCPRG
jgi:hypothetical protein